MLLERTWIGLNRAYTWEGDLDRFEELTRGMDGDGESLMAAAQLYRGEPSVEDRYEDWAMPVREQIQLKWRQVCLRLAGIHHARGAQEEAVGWLERVLEVDPLDEEAMQAPVGPGRGRSGQQPPSRPRAALPGPTRPAGRDCAVDEPGRRPVDGASDGNQTARRIPQRMMDV